MEIRFRGRAGERRAEARRPLAKCPGTYRAGGFLHRVLRLGSLFHFRAEDCSLTGMRMVARSPIDLSRGYSFTFADPAAGSAFHLTGTVVWVEPVTDPKDGSRGWRAGVRFDELGESQEVALREHLKRCGARDMTIRRQQVKRYYKDQLA